MNKRLFVMIAAALLLAAMPVAALDAVPVFAGNGTAENPFLIQNAENLSLLAEKVNSGADYTERDQDGTQRYNSSHYRVTRNLDLGGYAPGDGWIPIGNSSSPFSGGFNGDFRTIHNLTIRQTADTSLGLFGAVNGGAVSNVVLVNVSVTGSHDVGSLAGYVFTGSITNSSAAGTVSGISSVGGLVGSWMDGGSITNSSVVGNVTGNTITGYQYVGGLVGNMNGDISNSYAAVNVTGTGNRIGGLTGMTDGRISSSYVAGTVTGNRDVGGLTGRAHFKSSISNSVSLSAYVSGTANAGRIAGAGNGNLENVYAWEDMPVNGNLTADGDLNGTGVPSGAIWNPVLTPPSSSPWTTFTPDIWYVSEGYGSYLLPVLRWQTMAPDFDASYLMPKSPYFPAGGDGTASYPFLIRSPEDLWNLSNLTNTMAQFTYGRAGPSVNYATLNYTVIADIDLGGYSSGEGWNPVGNTSDGTGDGIFSGSFNGGFHTVSNLTIYRPDSRYQGLFGYAERAGFSNVHLSGVNVTGSEAVGGLTGSMSGSSISSSHIAGDVNGVRGTGGIAGHVSSSAWRSEYSSVTNVSFSGRVNGSDTTGGIAGYLSGDITDSFFTGNVTGSTNTGGLAGHVGDGRISHSYAAGIVTGDAENTGGLAGWVESGSINCSYAAGIVTGTSMTGGVAGSLSGDIMNSYTAGTVTGTSDTGGIAGWIRGNITDSYAAGTVTGTENTGGLAGRGGSAEWGTDISITDSYALNRYVSGSANVSRVLGCGEKTGTMTGISAWEGMETDSVFSTSAELYGRNVTSRQVWDTYPDGYIWTGSFSRSVWKPGTSGMYRLPVLTGLAAPDFDASYLVWYPADSGDDNGAELLAAVGMTPTAAPAVIPAPGPASSETLPTADPIADPVEKPEHSETLEPAETPVQTAVPTATRAAVPVAGILAGMLAAAVLGRK